MDFTRITKGAEMVGKKFMKHRATIYTAIGMVGVGITVYETAKATIKAKEIVDKEQLTDKKEIAKACWRLFVKPACFFLMTEIAIFAANKRNKAEIAALQIAGKIATDRYKEHVKKSRQMMSKTNSEKLESALGVEQAAKVGDGDPSKIYNTGKGDMLCFDMIQQRYFYSSSDYIRRVLLDLNEQLFYDDSNLNDVYMALGLPTSKIYDSYVWSKINDPTEHIEPSITFGEDENYRTQCLYLDLMPDFHINPRLRITDY